MNQHVQTHVAFVLFGQKLTSNPAIYYHDTVISMARLFPVSGINDVLRRY